MLKPYPKLYTLKYAYTYYCTRVRCDYKLVKVESLKYHTISYRLPLKLD